MENGQMRNIIRVNMEKEAKRIHVNECKMENGQMRNIIRVNMEKEAKRIDVNE
jgi:hypothetical protein